MNYSSQEYLQKFSFSQIIVIIGNKSNRSYGIEKNCNFAKIKWIIFNIRYNLRNFDFNGKLLTIGNYKIVLKIFLLD